MAETSEAGDELPMKNAHEIRSGDAERLRLKVLVICLAAGSMTLARIPVLAYAMASAFVSALGHIIWLQPWLVQEQSLSIAQPALCFELCAFRMS
jgi:hypothetical protein